LPPTEDGDAVTWVLAAALVVALVYGLHRLALWADSRSYIYYKTKPKFRGSSLGLIEGIYNPSVEHVVEERAGERARGSQDESGGKPDTGDESPE
jgi:hypothetical protein